MTRMLVAGVLATMLVIVLGPMFIRWLRRNEFGQNIREDGPQGHVEAKAGTPTMGGLLIFFAMTIPFFSPIGLQTATGFAVWMTMVLCALIGFWDDWMKISNRRSLGLSGRVKMLLLAGVTALLGFILTTYLDSGQTSSIPVTSLVIPLTEYHFDLGWAYFPLLFVVLAGASNGVNLTDGLDGLAGGTVVIALMAFLGINFITWERGLDSLGGRQGSIDLAIFTAALAGACVGFLWYNSFPAKVFMGDTGSMGLGGALAALAVVTKTELLLIVVGGVFVVEALSVMLQVTFFKRTGRRIFLMAPIHHHFELKAWSETQIMVRFWIVAGLFAATGFTIWFRTV